MIFFSRAIYLSFIASFFIMGLYNFLTDYEENSCEKTYMFEWPKYLEVPLEKSITEKFPRYKLYFYGEGKYAEESSNLELRRIPVLFIPGNAGSHKQVRSLGSVALRKAESTNFHFNYFSMDFDDDFSGMSGPLLYQQTEFTHECIKKILTLYSTAANKPSSVVLVGHSMEVPLEKSITEKFPRYKLYIYGEGKDAEESSNLELRGIPVLFIPGNAGSHKQVRSLGSVALRKAESTNFHFNYFSMDFDDDFSGMSGPLLYQQTEFTHECIKKILTLYSTAANKPSSVVLVGHSMGGFVARAVFTLPKFDTTTVTTIITQATPHRAPVSSVDSYMVELYNNVNDYWTSHVNTTLKYVTVLSTGGGFRDVLVPTSLTSLNGIVPFERGLSTSTMTTPRAWVSTDHLCHVWCKQIVLATKRAMFDMVDKNTKQIAVSPKYRMMAIHHHFGHNMGLKKMKPAFDKNIELDENIKWETRKRSSWRFSNSVSSVRYSVMPLPRDSERGAVIMSNIENDAWVGLCLLGLKEKKCKKLENMSPYATMVPPLYSERKVLHIEPDKLLHQSHLLVILPKTKKNAVVDLTAEIYNVTARKLTYELPGMFAGLMSAALGADPDSLPPEIVINETDHKAQFYNITVKGLDHVVSAWTAHLVVRRCASNVSTANFAGSLMKFHTPWAREDTFSFIRYGENGNLSLRLQSTRPEGATVFPELHLHLHPSCSYQVVITKDRVGALGRWAAYCAVLMPAYLVVQVIMSLSWQLKQLDEQGIAASFQFSHNRWAQPWRVGPVAMLLHFMLYFPEEASLASKVGLPADDFTLLQQKGVYFQPVPIFLYLTAYALVELFSFIAQIPFTVFGSIVFRLCGGCCQTVGFARAMRAVQCIVFTVAAIVASTTCGTLGIAIVYFTYFIKLIYEYQLARRREETLGEWAWNKFNVSFSLFLLLLMTVTLNIPSLITWVKNLRYSAVLDVDPSRSLGVSVALAALMLTFTDFPLPMTDLYGVMSGMAYISCILMLMYATDSTYRLSYFISANLLTIAIPLTLLVTIVTLTNKKQQPQVEEAEGRKEKDSDAEEGKEKEEASEESKPEERREGSLSTKRRARRSKFKSDE